ncbi:flagella basal body P-ring formation protein FlgA [Caulobacter ginsengisoli]|uniref:Flagella basal body P-ring formation protein FlgA n=1 Tax=Caulobacter ginsengisoli TaxID=400775 RepID=A0ABU0IK31_9CAUL|nr:flagellar basal body P-ring formation chaperone FlgA [Caulobacter ginsengisoli]MDQ0462365.1 flagella basal body P-ring formation protein FlgA [Caulobacter ginsengisoli]
MRRFLAVLALLAVATPALAGTVTLKPDIADADGKVTLGDLFDGAGGAAGVVVATRQGPSVVLDAALVQAFAARSGLSWANPQGLRRIVVRAGDAGGSAPVASRGNVEVLVYARSLSAGEIVQPTDLIWAKAAAAPADAPRDSDVVIGMAAKRPLREGAVVSLRDVSAPQVIKIGDTVNVTWSDGGMTLKLQAKALGAAAVGDAFNVINPASKKVIEAVASGPGEAVVGPEAQRLKAARSSQIALR